MMSQKSEKQKQAEKQENEAKIKTLIDYLDAKKKLFYVLVKSKKSIEKKKSIK